VPSSVREVRGWERRAVIALVDVGCWVDWEGNEVGCVLDWGREAGSAGGVRGPAGEAILGGCRVGRGVIQPEQWR
jgi:hypothetical protein